MEITPVIIVKDAELTICQTLESLKLFDEVIVYDTGSKDNSIKFAKKYKNVKLFEAEFEGYSNSKNKAVEFAKNDWILSIDADEVISPVLMDSILNLTLDNSSVYRFKRDNYYRNRKIKYSGWGKEFVIRIYNKTQTGFNEKLVHEHIDPKNLKIITLKGELRHYSYHCISHFVTKRDYYSELFAIENAGKRRSSPFMAFIRGAFDFLNTYIVKRGILDGYRGMLISVSNANVSFYKYLKLYEANILNNRRISFIIHNNNNQKLIPLLNSIIHQTIPPDEIIVYEEIFNFGLKKEIGAYAEKCFIPISYLNNTNSNSDYDGKISAIEKARYNYIIYINSNYILHKDYIQDHISKAHKGYLITSRTSVLDQKSFEMLLNGESQKKIHIPKLSTFKRFLFHLIIPFTTLIKRYRSLDCIRTTNCSFYKTDFDNLKEDIKKLNFNSSTNLPLSLSESGLKTKHLRFSGISYKLSDESKIKILVCLDRLKLLNCGLGQVALNFGKELVKIKTSQYKIDFLLPAKGFPEFEKRTGFVRQNIFKHFYSGYMKKYDLCHVTHQLPSYSFGKSKYNILTIHDLNFIYTKSKSKSKKYLQSLQANINKSDAIVFISEFTKETTYKYLHVPDNKIIKVIHNGVQFPINSKVKPSWLPKKRFLFSIGQFLEKKNFHVLLPFLKILPKDYILVIAGENHTSYGQKIEQLAIKLKIHDRIIFPGGISEEEKGYLYNHCEAFLFPSVAEGFGLPVIEAMLCLKPVFCSNRTSLKEIGDKFAFFWYNFEPIEMLDVFNKGMEVFNMNGYKEEQKKYADTFTYERNVSEYLKLYENLVL